MNEPTERTRYVYGPVPSRRLGLSLGVDLLPYKTCTYDCVYCQLGRTNKQCVLRKEYVATAAVLEDIKEALSPKQRIDYITLSGSGEPTLHAGIGYLIGEIKELSNTPVAVITNSSLLHEEDVRYALMDADLVVPSLDAGREETFRLINRPHEGIRFNDMVEGLNCFSNAFKGKLWLEIMFVSGMNDSDGEVASLSERLHEIRADRIQLNTVYRPPAERSSQAVSSGRLQEICGMLGEHAELVTEFHGKTQDTAVAKDERRILELIERRPVTVLDIVAALGIHRNGVLKYLSILEKNGKVRTVKITDRIYYEAIED